VSALVAVSEGSEELAGRGSRTGSMKRCGHRVAASARGSARVEGVIASAGVQMAQYAIDDGRLGDDGDDSKLDLTSGT